VAHAGFGRSACRFTANVLASAAQYERDLISARTNEGTAQRKIDGGPVAGCAYTG